MIFTQIRVNHDLGSDLSEKFEALFPNWPSVVATLIALVIILIVLTKLVWNKVKKMVKDRQDFIQNNIDQSITQNNEAIVDREKANAELLEARTQAADIISKAKLKADAVKDTYIASAKDEAKKIVTDAQKDMGREREIFEKESKKEIVEVALAAASKIVEREVDSKTNRKIVEDFVKAK